eukprot:6213493-Pleurochrysis_carterae.AAC.4
MEVRWMLPIGMVARQRGTMQKVHRVTVTARAVGQANLKCPESGLARVANSHRMIALYVSIEHVHNEGSAADIFLETDSFTRGRCFAHSSTISQHFNLLSLLTYTTHERFITVDSDTETAILRIHNLQKYRLFMEHQAARPSSSNVGKDF